MDVFSNPVILQYLKSLGPGSKACRDDGYMGRDDGYMGRGDGCMGLGDGCMGRDDGYMSWGDVYMGRDDRCVDSIYLALKRLQS